jgi:SHS2 domain-containing protein
VHEWAEHTSELELWIEAESAEDVFTEALGAVAELMEGGSGGAAARHEIAVSAPDRATLLAEWLNELVFLAETQGFVPGSIEAISIGDRELEARVAGDRGAPRPLVKAVTYHRLKLEKHNGTWRARVIFDV